MFPSSVSRPQNKSAPKIAVFENNIETGIEMGAEVQEVPDSSPSNLKPLKTTEIPEISYSSSEDEDFFDAEDDEDEPVTAPEMKTPPSLDLTPSGSERILEEFVEVSLFYPFVKNSA